MRRQRAATAIAPIVKELIYSIHSQGRGWQSTSAERWVCDVKSCSEGPRFRFWDRDRHSKGTWHCAEESDDWQSGLHLARGTGPAPRPPCQLGALPSRRLGPGPLIRMAVGHYQFEAMHPFTDGNGRTGRILNLLFLVEQGLLDQPVLISVAPSSSRRTEYDRLLNNVTRDDAWEPWVLYMLDAVHDTAALDDEEDQGDSRVASASDRARMGACAVALQPRAGGAGVRVALQPHRQRRFSRYREVADRISVFEGAMRHRRAARSEGRT